mgnify:CR=1 FL=1
MKALPKRKGNGEDAADAVIDVSASMKVPTKL